MKNLHAEYTRNPYKSRKQLQCIYLIKLAHRIYDDFPQINKEKSDNDLNSIKDVNRHLAKQNIQIGIFHTKSAQFHYPSEKCKLNPQ